MSYLLTGDEGSVPCLLLEAGHCILRYITLVRVVVGWQPGRELYSSVQFSSVQWFL